MFLNDFVNRNARCVAATEYTPNAAPQRYYLDVNNSVNHSNVTLSTLPVGKTFLFEAYPNTYPGKWYRFELDSLSEKGFICPWVSETGRFLINSDEDTLCFSVIPGSTKVYVHNGHTDAMRASFSGSDTSEEKEYAFHATSEGLTEYIILNDDSTFYEQKCLFCLENTSQCLGRVTYICDECGSPGREENKCNFKQLEKQINEIGISNLHEQCVGCKSPFIGNDMHVYHKLGELKFCVTCIAANLCNCFICSKGSEYRYSEEVNALRQTYLVKEMKLNMRISQNQTPPLSSAALVKDLAMCVNSFLSRERTDKELFVLKHMKNTTTEYIVNHGGQLLPNKKCFRKYFFDSKESPLMWEIVQYYANLCRDSALAKKNGVTVLYTDKDPDVEIKNILEKPRNGIHIFVGRKSDVNWHGYEVNLTKKNEVRIVYFDTSETNNEMTPFIKAAVNSILEREVSLLVDGNWKYTRGGFKQEQPSNVRNNGLYLLFFLNSRCGNLQTNLTHHKLEAMRQHLFLALLTGEPFYF